MILFFDTETTGKADFRSEPDAAHQPRLVQLAAVLTKDDGTELASLSTIIRPDGFHIPREASAIHGIDTAMARDCGVPIRFVLPLFSSFISRADMAVAHNITFDRWIMNGEAMRSGSEPYFDGIYREFCTMHAMTPVCKIPNQYSYDQYKWPKLQEAYKFAFGQEFTGAHNALADVRACASIYFWLNRNGGAK